MIESIEKKTKKEEGEKEKEVEKKEERIVMRIECPAAPNTPGCQTLRKSGKRDLAPETGMAQSACQWYPGGTYGVGS